MSKNIIERPPTVIREKCGTLAGYVAHTDRKEITCLACRNARREYSAMRYKTDPVRARAYVAETRKRHPASVKASYRKWLAANKESEQIRGLKYRADNAEKVKEAAAKFRATHPESRRKHERKRRARKKSVPHQPYTTQDILNAYGSNCHICHEPVDLSASRHAGDEGWQRGLHLDHVIPLSRGGPDLIENVKPSHGECNMKKSVA